MNPLWIVIPGVFEGHQGHWADCFFSNATRDEIETAVAVWPLFQGETVSFSEMTDEQLTKWPEASTFRDHLISEYGSD